MSIQPPVQPSVQQPVQPPVQQADQPTQSPAINPSFGDSSDGQPVLQPQLSQDSYNPTPAEEPSKPRINWLGIGIAVLLAGGAFLGGRASVGTKVAEVAKAAEAPKVDSDEVKTLKQKVIDLTNVKKTSAEFINKLVDAYGKIKENVIFKTFFSKVKKDWDELFVKVPEE